MTTAYVAILIFVFHGSPTLSASNQFTSWSECQAYVNNVAAALAAIGAVSDSVCMQANGLVPHKGGPIVSRQP